MAVVLFDHACIGMPQVLSDYEQGYAIIVARLAEV